jgi:hypothetical protein
MVVLGRVGLGWVHGILLTDNEAAAPLSATPPRQVYCVIVIFGFTPKRTGRKTNFNFAGLMRRMRFGL